MRVRLAAPALQPAASADGARIPTAGFTAPQISFRELRNHEIPICAAAPLSLADIGTTRNTTASLEPRRRRRRPGRSPQPTSRADRRQTPAATGKENLCRNGQTLRPS